MMRLSVIIIVLLAASLAAFPAAVDAFLPLNTERTFVPPRHTSASASSCNGISNGHNREGGTGDPLNNRHSASDWLYNVRSLPESKVLREIRNPVLSVFGWSLFVSVVHRVLNCSGLAAAAAQMTIPGTAHSFLVSALGLLLVFRTNSAYQRFNEGRKIWENILSVSRNMSRMIQLYSREVGPERKKRITNLVAAYPYLLRQHIRPGCLCSDAEIPDPHRLLLHEQRHVLHETRHEGQDVSVSKQIQKLQRPPSPDSAKNCWVDKRELPWSLFLPTSLPAIARAENRPLWVCDRMAALIANIPYGPNFTSRERLALLGMVDKLTNAVGQCERIHQTAVPLNYARHSLRSLTLWLFTLPFALVQDLGLFTAPANAAIAWLFFGVYQIGYSIEDPFQGSLRLSILCDAIRRSVIRQAADMRDSAYQLDNDYFYDPDEPPSASGSSGQLLLPDECMSTASSSSNQAHELPEECMVPLQEAIRRSVNRQADSSNDTPTMQLTTSIGDSMTKPLKLTTLPDENDYDVMTESWLQDEIQQQQLSLPSSHFNNKDYSEAASTASQLAEEKQEFPAESLLQDDPLPQPPFVLDEKMLNVPKIVLRQSNGTWAEVGI